MSDDYVTGQQAAFGDNDDSEYFGMRYDIVFKKAFVENNDLLTKFISDMLDIPFEYIGEVTVSNPELIPNGTDEKFSRLDT